MGLVSHTLLAMADKQMVVDPFRPRYVLIGTSVVRRVSRSIYELLYIEIYG